MPFDTIYSFLPDTCSSLQYHRCRVTHPLFIQFEQGVPHLGGVWGQAKAVLVQLRHDELQQPLGSQASGGRVSSRRGHRLLQDGTSQSLHLRTGFTLNTSGRINFTHRTGEARCFYLCGAKYDSTVVLSAAGSFFLLSTEADGHRPEAFVNSKKILMFCDGRTDK